MHAVCPVLPCSTRGHTERLSTQASTCNTQNWHLCALLDVVCILFHGGDADVHRFFLHFRMHVRELHQRVLGSPQERLHVHCRIVSFHGGHGFWLLAIEAMLEKLLPRSVEW